MERVGVLSRHVAASKSGRRDGDRPGLGPSPTAATALYPPGKHFVTDPSARLARYQGDGGATPARTFPEAFLERAKTHPTVRSLAQKRGARDGPWTFWTWGDYLQEVRKAGKALVALGCPQHSAVSILGFNAPEWFFAAVGAIFAGMTPAGIYITNGPDGVGYVLRHSKSRVVFVDSDPQLQKVLAVRGECPDLTTVVHWGSDCPPDGSVAGVLSWASFVELGAKQTDAALDARVAAQRPDNACYLSYTSGTTGPPKAVMYSHDNACWGFAQLGKYFLDQAREMGPVGMEEREVSYMPLSHIAGNTHLLGLPVRPLNVNSCVYFAFPDAMQGTLPQTLKEVRPTLFLAVPRVWEKFHAALEPAIKAQPALKQKPQALKELLGLDQVKQVMTGAAPITREIMDFFDGIQLPIYEIYGMTENTAYSHFNLAGRRRLGSVGPELADEGAGSKIAPGSGEICTWSRAVMMGYMYDPEKSAQAFDDEGYLRTGDVGRVDEDGFTFITGRIKELIITAGGENCAPVLLEEAITSRLPAISNAVMIGDRQKYLVALLTLKLEPDGRGGFLDRLAPEALAVDPKCKTAADALRSEVWRQYIQKGVDEANEAAVSRAQSTRKWVILPGDFVPVGENPELTPTMKLRREVVRKKYEAVIKDIYAADYMQG